MVKSDKRVMNRRSDHRRKGKMKKTTAASPQHSIAYLKITDTFSGSGTTQMEDQPWMKYTNPYK